MLTKMMVTLAVGLGVSVAACNGSVTTDPPGSGGSGTTSAVTSTTSAVGSTGSGGPCAAFDDAAGTGAVTVRFHNNTGAPVYLPALCDTIDYTISPVGVKDDTTYNFDPSCLQTCQDLQTTSPFACGACAPRSYLLPTGGTREVVWNGTGLKYGIDMPAACYFTPPQGNTCPLIVGAPGGTYGIQALGFNSCGAGCTCDAQGICSGSTAGDQAFANPVKFAFPQDKVVEVVFDNCAFGCPGGAD